MRFMGGGGGGGGFALIYARKLSIFTASLTGALAGSSFVSELVWLEEGEGLEELDVVQAVAHHPRQARLPVTGVIKKTSFAKWEGVQKTTIIITRHVHSDLTCWRTTKKVIKTADLL